MTAPVLDRAPVHYMWDASLEPAVTVRPGEEVEFATADVSDGQITPGCPVSALARVDFGRLYPLVGPVYIEGAEPGDALDVAIVSMQPGDWGWAAVIPGMGLLPDDFPRPHLRHFDLSNGRTTQLGDGVRIPLEPFCGAMGVAVDEPGRHPIMTPTKAGGNLDVRDLGVGARLRLPVLVPGALFSAGDCHAAQGDGEVCLTALECPMRFRLRFDVVKGAAPRAWGVEFSIPPRPAQARESAGYQAFTALGRDPVAAARDAVRRTIEWLGRERHLSPEDAFILCSLAADLRISQAVDAPYWAVSAYLPLALFD